MFVIFPAAVVEFSDLAASMSDSEASSMEAALETT